MLTTFAPLDLRHLTPAAQGSERRVYLHPRDDDLVVKTIIPRDARNLSLRTMRGLTTRLFSSVLTRSTIAEQKEQARTLSAAQANFGRPPFALHYGFVQTTQGWGALAQRVADPHGRLGPTLLQLSRTGDLTEEVVELLNDTARRMELYGVQASDMNAKNFVLGTRGDGREVVLVDGLGDVHALPLRRLSRRFNRASQDRAFRKCAARLGLEWDSAAWRFHKS
ncbi:YrbL family protein [Rhodosalinus sp. FB01]|uniref:YrbL family protein n=1 Tax=Rhodosalinus sp. FB01 TaxID=3239194 RepID=UPI0035236706